MLGLPVVRAREEAPHALEKTLLARCMPPGMKPQRFIQVPHQLALLGREVHRGLNDHPAEKIAARPTAHRLHALVAQAKYASGLGLGGNLQRYIPFQRRHVDRATERRRGEAHRHLAAQVLPLALENRMLAHVHFDIEVPGRTAVATRFALARQSHAITTVHAGRDLDRELARAAHAALPQAAVAGIANDRTGAATARTGLLQLEEALGDAHLACTAAALAGGGGAALGGAAAMAGLALGELRHLDFHLVAEHCLIQVELQFVAQVGAAEHLRAAAPTAAAEDVAERIPGTEATPARARRRLDAGVPVLVVERALVRIGEHFGCLLGFLEALLRLPVLRVALGVIFQRETTRSLFDLRARRRLRYVEYFVV